MVSIEKGWYSRKFILAVMVVASATGLCWFGHIADGVYSAVVIATVAAYISGNVWQKSLTATDHTKYAQGGILPTE